MSEISSNLSGVADTDARSALYYLGRYVKQAEYFQAYGKDIFDEEERSAPTEQVKQITLRLIMIIEKRENVSMAHLGTEAVTRILTEITTIEESLGFEASPDDLERAEKFFSSMKIPQLE